MTVFDVPVFDGLATAQILALGLVFAASFFVKGVFGYGAVPLLIVAGSFVVEPHHAVVLAAVSNVLTHLQYLPSGFREGRTRLAGQLALFILPMIVIGVWIFSRIGGDSLNMFAGAVILASIAFDSFGWLDRIAPFVRRNVRVVGPAFGMLAGLISGMIGAGSISFISLYIKVLVPDRAAFRATIILVTGAILVWRIFILSLSGMVTHGIVAEALLLLPGALLAGVVGARVSRRLSDRSFFAAYRAVLAFGAAAMILRGAAG